MNTICQIHQTQTNRIMMQFIQNKNVLYIIILWGQMLIIWIWNVFSVVTASHTVENQYAGTMFVELKTKVLADSGLVIYCDIIGDSAVTFTWIWRGSYTEQVNDIFEWDTDPRVVNENTRTSTTLRWKNGISDSVKRAITNRTLFAEGAHLDDPDVKNQCEDTTLIVTWNPGKPTVHITQNPIISGNTADIRCEVTDEGNPTGKVTWIGDHITGSESETMQFEVTKAHYQSTWACYYTNMAGKGYTSETATLDVHWPPGPSSLTIDYDGEVIERGNRLKLTCICDDKGNPVGHVVWKLGDADTTRTSDVVEITSNNENDYNGNWKCYYENDIDKGQASDTRNVEVKWAASGVDLLILNSAEQLNEDDSLFLKCINSDAGNPIASDVTFTLNGVTFTNIDRINTTTHRIESISRRTNGSLKCCYGNIAGTKCSGPKDILVRWAVSTDGSIKVADPSRDIRVGDDVTLECDLSDKGSPEAIVNWTHNSTMKYDTINSTITLNNVKITDNGEWECTANNTFSSSNVASYTLRVLPRSATYVDVSTITSAVLGALLIVSIVALVVFICLYYRQRKVLGGSVPNETAVHYANVGSDAVSGGISNMSATTVYEDVTSTTQFNGQSRITENTTYMDLDQNDVQQAQNRPPELYQSLN